MNKLLATLALATGLAAAASAAPAQSTDATAAPEARPQPRAERMHRHPAQQPRLSAAERVEARLAYLRTALKITAAQQPQWEAFADVLRRHAAQRDQWHEKRRAEAGGRQPGERYTAIDRLERRQQAMTLASEQLSEILAAAKPLYAALTPEQQRIADELVARRGRGHPGHHSHGMRRGA